MRALVDYDSDGHSSGDYTPSELSGEAFEQPQMPEDVDVIIREMRSELEQARLKADQLICQFAEAYVETAGQFREEAIQRYRERLEGLPAKDCAKVCETLAKDDIFCCNMEFGNGHLSYGGMSFTYKVESDATFNALSHHAWKDLHQLFVKDEPSLPLGNALEQDRSSVAHFMHSDDDEGELELHKDRSVSSSEESDSSSDDENPLCSHDSRRAFPAANRERGRSSSSSSPDWDTENEVEGSDAPKKRGPGRPRKHQDDSGAPEKRRCEPWSAEEEALIREKMAMQLQMKGNLGFGHKTAMELLEIFPGRTASAITNKWSSLKTKDIWDDLGGPEGKVRSRDARGKVRVETPGLEKQYGGDSGSLTLYNDPNDDASDNREIKPGSHDMNSLIKNGWPPEQDRLLTEMMQSEMQSTGVAAMSVPPAVQKRLARSFGRKEKSISRRWSYLLGSATWGGAEKRKRKEHVVGFIMAEAEPQNQTEEQSSASSSRLPRSDTSMQSEAAEASEPRLSSQSTKEPRASTWSPQEVEALTRLTQGSNRMADIDFKDVAARLPSVSMRTEKACKVFWARHVQPHRPDKDRDLIHGDEAPEKGGPDSYSKLGPLLPKKGKKRGPEASSDFGSPKHSKKAKIASKNKPLQSEKVRRTSQGSRRNLWTLEEDDLLWRLALPGIPWKEVAAQIPHRTSSACQVRYSLHLAKMPEYQERLNGQPGRPIRRYPHSKRNPKSDQDSPVGEDTVVSVARRSKHSRKSGDEGKKQVAAHQNRHGGADSQSPLRLPDNDEGSDAEESDVYMYEFE